MEWDTDLIGPLEAKVRELKQLKEAHYLSLVAHDPRVVLDARRELMLRVLAHLTGSIAELHNWIKAQDEIKQEES